MAIKIDKTALAQRINALEGLDAESKSQLLELLHERKRYGLVWEEKEEDVEERLRNELPVLREVKERAIIADDPDAPNHILIEGDNLEALTTLSYTHENQIDVIYIDPPYNTGNKDFVYNDRFVDADDEYRHSKWLSFMAKRLRIAKRLLSDKGVIFISIDDNEQAALKLLCDEVFEEKNFVGTYFWKRTSTPPALSYKIRRKQEFILCYQKMDTPQRIYSQGYVDGGDAPLLNTGNPLGVLSFPKGIVHFGIPDGEYSAERSYKIRLLDNVIVKDGINENDFRAEGHFKWGQQNLDREVNDGTYFLIKTKQFSPRFQKATKTTKVPSNIIDDEVSVGTNEDAQKELVSIGIDFNYAKPSSLVCFLIRMPFWNDKDITILDFFAGSGTTLHATMQLNAEDGGHRKCILVTNNENHICEEVTYERNKRVINGYTTPKGEQVAGLRNNTLRYYQTDFVARNSSATAKRELMRAATDMLCIKNDIYTEQPLFGNRKFRKDVLRYFADGSRAMLIIYTPDAIETVVEQLQTMHPATPVIVYVFSLNDYAMDADFETVADRVELCALPAAILNAYRKVLPRKQQPTQSEEDAL